MNSEPFTESKVKPVGTKGKVVLYSSVHTHGLSPTLTTWCTYHTQARPADDMEPDPAASRSLFQQIWPSRWLHLFNATADTACYILRTRMLKNDFKKLIFYPTVKEQTIFINSLRVIREWRLVCFQVFFVFYVTSKGRCFEQKDIHGALTPLFAAMQHSASLSQRRGFAW